MIVIPTYSELKKNAKLDNEEYKRIKVAILGDTSTQFLTIALKGFANQYKLSLDIFEADFNQIDRQVFDKSSDLYAFAPQIIILFHAAEKMLLRFYKNDVEEKTRFGANHIQLVANLYDTLSSNIGCKVIYYNLCEINNSILGNYANKTTASFIYQLRKINFELMNLAEAKQDLFICDICALQAQIGRSVSFAQSIYINTDMVLSLDLVPLIAKNTMDIIACMYGRMIKCIVLDLDNTLWGGVIGDDGIENIQIGNLGIGKAFTEFQYWLKNLKERGILLAVCSKNTEAVAKGAFKEHPDMVLQLEDFCVFVANWENKSDNMRYIQSVLNIGFDSMVFLDDNPFERNMVRENIKDILVPELPEDPALYIDYLCTMNLFEVTGLSIEDTQRTALYQEDAQRAILQRSFTNELSYLASLEMVSEVDVFNSFNIPRVAQLSQRSNQFNLRTVRYSESDIVRMAANSTYVTFTYTLQDKFGDNGLICVVIMRKESEQQLFIDSWFMSCRVLKRSMEQFTLNTLVKYAMQNGYTQIIGEYIPTAKNDLVKDHYAQLGFTAHDNKWLLLVNDYEEKKTYIKSKIKIYEQRYFTATTE